MTRIEASRDEAAVRRFVEQFALSFSDLGVPRMAARVLGALMVTDEPGLTAREIAERLGVSAAAISGALRYLLHVNLLLREPVPNSRRDRYHAPDDIWYTAAVQSGVYRKLGELLHQGVLAVGGDASPSGTRLADMRDFLFFVQDEMAELVERWNETRPRRDGKPNG